MAYLWIILIVNAHIDSTQPVLQIHTSPQELEAVTELWQMLQRKHSHMVYVFGMHMLFW